MNKKSYTLIYIGLLLIFVVFVSMIIGDYKQTDLDSDKNNLSERIKENSVFDFEENIQIENIKFVKEEYSYLVSFDLIMKEENNKKYNMYLLDKENNLLYTFYDIVLSNNVNERKPYVFNISYDISSLNKIVVLEQSKKIDYKEDISDALTYIGKQTNNQSVEIKLPMTNY